MEKRKAFTLIELAIVMVIIGILLGAIIKGQEMIKNARVKKLQGQTRDIEAKIWAFYDRYGRYPGDCDENKLIDPAIRDDTTGFDNNPHDAFCTGSTADSDIDRPWAELEKADFYAADVSNAQNARNTFGGVIYLGFANDTVNNKQYNALGIVNIPCYAAKTLDTSIDGNMNATGGRVRRYIGHNLEATYNWTNICSTEDTEVDIAYMFEKSAR